MITEFRQWLQRMVTPTRYALLTGTLDSLIEVNGTEFQEVETILWSRIDHEDNLAILDRTHSECLVWLVQTLTKFSIVLDDNHLDVEAIQDLTEILQAVVILDAYELPGELLDILDTTEDNRDALAMLVAVVHGKDFANYIHYIKDLSPLLLDAIRKNAIERKDLQEVFDIEDGISNEIVKRFKSIMDQIALPPEDKVVNYLTHVGKIGLRVEAYVSLLGDVLLEDTDPELTAKRWLLITYASSDQPEDVSKLFELVYSDVRRIMRINSFYTRLGALLK